MKLPNVKVKTEYTKFQGGLNLESPALSIDPGNLLAGMNYMADSDGGYSRIDGFEIYDGCSSPSAGTYRYCTVVLTGTVNVGDTITGADSSATGVVVVNDTTSLCITKITGTFTADEVFSVGGVPKGSMTSLPVLKGEPTGAGNAIALAAVADNYRADIAAPAGSGAVRGVGLLKGILYCFRDNAGATAGLIYKATASGWASVSLYHEINFDTGVAAISDGDSIAQLTSGAIAIVKRVVKKTGTWAGSNAAGKLIITAITGTFDDTHALQVGGATKATSTSVATQITISPGGRYETIEHNFFASTDTKRMYGCDGVNRSFEFDGTVYVPIDTGMTTDTPEYIYAHKKQLFLSFKGSSQNSGIGTPYVWTPITGAAEIGIGDDITGYSELPGKALAIFARNLSEQLLGSSTADYVLDSISNEVGCIPRTAQKLGHVYCLDDRGIIRITPTESYGNFAQNTISQQIQSVINTIRGVVTATTLYKSRNQYRLYGSDGTGVCMTICRAKYGDVFSFTQFKYPVDISCTVTGEDTNGKDVVFLGATNGKVYQADKGSSFDGEDIEAYLRLPFNNSKAPTILKTYRKATIEMTAIGHSEVRFHPDFSYGDPDISQHVTKTLEIQGAGGYWDIDTWETFYYDSFIVSSPSFPINGDGVNLGLMVYSKSATDLGHKIDGAVISYTPRRLVR